MLARHDLQARLNSAIAQQEFTLRYQPFVDIPAGAAVGSPGIAEVSQGCILLRSTPQHDRQRQAA